MNYIFVHLLNDMSGSPRVLSDLIKNFPSEGKKILLTNRTRGFLDCQDVDGVYKIFYVLKSNVYIKLLLYILSQIQMFFVLFFLLLSIRYKREERSTVIINTVLPFGAALAAHLLSDKVVYYIHETSIRPYLLNKFLAKIVRIAADEVIFVSYYVKHFYEHVAEGKKCHVIYNPLRSDFNCNTLSKCCPFDERYILYVGTLKEYKGIFNLIKLASMLSHKQFVAVINEDVDVYNSFMSDNEIPLNLRFERRPQNLAEIYSRALFTLNLSLPNLCIETFGLTLLESMHFSVPVIAPNYGGPKEIVNEHVGFLVEPSELVNIKNIILNTDEALWNMLSSNSFQHSKKFDLENYVCKISKII
ncbi:glycosyltransferase family 4 protein [Aeromonas veronii]|uniref:glycosyltransferase family 4 protein n=1 Tax=Aeromonas veronii TaxID=654 RepID=UPI001F366E6D|nr:glycosyltransferase family 4 protein [Aeromonas veronii]MCF5718732.1 glycosyltransferase family 4 protein [Aeromonas veronii]